MHYRYSVMLRDSEFIIGIVLCWLRDSACIIGIVLY